jgi:hypothetical protein
MSKGKRWDVRAEQHTLAINRNRNFGSTRLPAESRAGALRHNMCKYGQTSPQALATVADDERVGRIDHPSLDTVQRSHLGDIHKASTLIVFQARPIPHRQPLRAPTPTTGPTTQTRRTEDHCKERGVITVKKASPDCDPISCWTPLLHPLAANSRI